MKKERKREIEEMASGIGHTDDNFKIEKKVVTSPAETLRSSVKKPEEIIATKKLEIPVCKSTPVNGRIYVVSVAGADMKTPGGLILPPTFGTKKNEQVEGVKRYFAVAWDKDEIPKSILDKLRVGIELNPFLPQNAEEWQLPRIVDWMGNNIFEVIHWSELAGISSVQPEEAS